MGGWVRLDLYIVQLVTFTGVVIVVHSLQRRLRLAMLPSPVLLYTCSRTPSPMLIEPANNSARPSTMTVFDVAFSCAFLRGSSCCQRR